MNIYKVTLDGDIRGCGFTNTYHVLADGASEACDKALKVFKEQHDPEYPKILDLKLLDIDNIII
jgi:hypothetical protein